MEESEDAVNHTDPKLQVNVLALAYGGEFIGEVQEPSAHLGKKAFLRKVAPGEIVEALMVSQQERFLRAEPLTIRNSSAQRQDPPCPFFGNCGGCDLQHLNLPYQRRLKREMVESMLLKQAGLKPDKDVSLAGEHLAGFHYRKRLALHLNQDGELGLYRQGSNQVVPIDKCFIACAEINQNLPLLSAALREFGAVFESVYVEYAAGQVLVVLKTRTVVQAKTELLEKIKNLKEALSSFKILNGAEVIYAQLQFKPVSRQDSLLAQAGHFSQVNPEANELLRELVCSRVKFSNVSELYAGAGNFSLPLAESGKKVAAVEIDPELSRQAEASLVSLGLQERVTFFNLSCEKYVRANALNETVVLDPPRSGAKEVVKSFKPGQTKQVIYISCNLPSLCRDLKTLAAKGFALMQVLVLDMFPQTHHVEVVAIAEGR
jgi:23S rRNA (uracil1939-C5)-methyltransferase